MRNPKMRFRTLQDEHYSDYESRALKDVCTIKREIIDISKQGNSKFLEYSMPAFDAGCLPNPILGMDAKSGRIPIYGDVLLFNKLNVRKKRIWNIHNCPKNSICSAEFMPIVTTEVLQDYMYYLVSTEKFTKILEECSSGTSNSQKRITPSVFLGQILNFPCYEEQQKIAAFFTALDEKINIEKSRLKNLKNLYNLAVSKAFDESKAENVPLSKVASFHSGLTYKPTDVASNGTIVLRSTNIQNNHLELYDKVFVSLNIHEKLKCRVGDILMCVRNGSRRLVGKTALIDQSAKDCTWGAFMMIIRSIEDNHWVHHYFRSDNFRLQINNDSNTATINQITKGMLNDCLIPWPVEENRKLFSELLDLIEKRITVSEEKIEQLNRLKKAFMQQMFV